MRGADRAIARANRQPHALSAGLVAEVVSRTARRLTLTVSAHITITAAYSSADV